MPFLVDVEEKKYCTIATKKFVNNLDLEKQKILVGNWLATRKYLGLVKKRVAISWQFRFFATRNRGIPPV